MTVRTKEEFINEVKRWATDDAYLKKMMRTADRTSRSWGILDGHSVERIRALFDELSRPPAVVDGGRLASVASRRADL